MFIMLLFAFCNCLIIDGRIYSVLTIDELKYSKNVNIFCNLYIRSNLKYPRQFNSRLHMGQDSVAGPEPVSLTVFLSQFKFDGNIVSLSPRF